MLDATALIARFGVNTVDWVGPSMGGLLGIMLGAQPDTFIELLVINDDREVAPEIRTHG
jgi:pimeloyl-ACP methyl ester carboxylesterase